MAFHYRLEALLRLQRSVEHQEENRLLACMVQVAKAREELRAWEEWRWQRKREACSEAAGGSSGALLRFAAEWDEAARRGEKQMQEGLKAAEATAQKQRQVYREARQKREILEGLKDRQESVYSIEQLRQVQRSLDEAHLLRSVYGER
jgi:flagellar export protein FliJ